MWRTSLALGHFQGNMEVLMGLLLRLWDSLRALLAEPDATPACLPQHPCRKQSPHVSDICTYMPQPGGIVMLQPLHVEPSNLSKSDKGKLHNCGA